MYDSKKHIVGGAKVSDKMLYLSLLKQIMFDGGGMAYTLTQKEVGLAHRY